MTIRLKMLLYFFVVVISTASLLTFIAINSSNQIIKEEIENELNALVDQKLKNLYWYVSSKERELRNMASLQIIKNAMQEFSTVFKHGTDSQEYIKANGQYDVYLEDLKNRVHAYDIFLIDVHGNIVYTDLHESDFATNLLIGAYKETELNHAFVSAIELLESKISEFSVYSPSLIEGDQEQSAFIAAPVFNDGVIQGVLAIQLRSDDHYYLSKDYTGIKKSGEVVISKMDGTDALVIAPLRRDPDAAFKRRYAIGADNALPIQWSVQGRNGSGISTGYEGTEIFAAWRYIPELKWGIVVKIETEEVFSTVQRLRNVFLLAGIVITFFVLIFALFISRKLTTPLLNLVEATDKTAKGDYDQNIQVTSHDEIGVLTQSFNHMLEARKKNEGILAKSNSKLSLIIESTNAGIWEWDLTTGGTVLNERWAEMIGYSLAELQPVTLDKWESLCHPDDYGPAQKVIREHLKNKTDRFAIELRIKHKQGHWVWVLDIGMAVEWDSIGRPKRMMGIHLDISDTKKNEEVLRIAKEQAEQGEKSKSEFLASMSHEIRTPMNGVLGLLSLLKKEDLTPDQSRKVSTAKNSAESLLTLINDILDFSKIEAGKIELDILDFNLLNLFEDLASMMVFKAEEKNIELIVDVMGIEQELVKGDSGRIRQVITNLVGNAIKFTGQGQVVIKASCHSSGGSEAVFTCEIIDSGIGINQAQQDVLFEKFTQADASTTRKYGGTGLGLSISKNLCEIMGGEIKVDSELGQGSTFTFTLPLETSTERDLLSPKIDITDMSFLLLIKNESARNTMSAVLHKLGSKVHAPDFNGHLMEERSYYHEHTFKVVIMDHVFEPMFNDIYKTVNHPDCNWVLLCPVNTPHSTEDLNTSMFNAALLKPFTLSGLFGTLSKLFKDDARYHFHTTNLEPADSHAEQAWPQDARILLVEDNEINQMVAQSLLQDMGLECDVAGNGQVALDLLAAPSQNPFTLILMDCQMPIMDGYTATENIRNGAAGDAYKDISIIAMTANAMKGDREKCLDAGMNDYLTKPVDEHMLRATLQRYLLSE